MLQPSHCTGRRLSRAIILVTIAGLVAAAEGSVVNLKLDDSGPDLGKGFTWKINGLSQAQFDKAKGEYVLKARAFADCDHDDPVDVKPSDKKDKWLLKDGFKEVTFDPEPHAKVTHAESRANAKAKADPAGYDAVKKIATISGSLSVKGETTASRCDKGRSESKAESSVKLKYSTETLGVDIVSSNIKQKPGKGGRGGEGTGEECAESKWEDPIAFGLTDLTTGEQWTEELYSLSVAADGSTGSFEWQWDENGVWLATPKDDNGEVRGTIAVEGGTPSLWVQNPVAPFFASLVDGVFSVGGAWAGLDWELNLDDGAVVSAFLPYSEYATDIDLNVVVPPELIDPDHEYLMEASDEERCSLRACNVPSPSAASSVIAMMLAAGGYRRRR